MADHTLAAETLHHHWDRGIPPVLEVDPGDTVSIATWDPYAHALGPDSDASDLETRPEFVGHALTGPVFVKGARPGDTLRVDVLAVEPASWGYTAAYPDRGLLAGDLSRPHLQIWDLSDGRRARGLPGASVPIVPFCGVLGVAPSAPGPHRTTPPRRVGGNLDVPQLIAGSSLLLPVEVEGALFSAGDAHAAQGEGEVCVTAIEMDSATTVRLTVLRSPADQLSWTSPGRPPRGPVLGFSSCGPDLYDASREAVRALIRWLGRHRRMAPEDAYVLASVAADLRISQVVNAPTWTVSALLPEGVLE